MIKNLEIDHRVACGAFDLDGNIFDTPTPIYLKNRETSDTLQIPGYLLDQDPSLIAGESAPYMLHSDPEDSFGEFRDFSSIDGHRGADGLKHDVQESIERRLFAPSFESFKHTFLVKARFFAIITARGHSMENLERTMRTINDSVLAPEEKQEQLANIHTLWRQRYGNRDPEGEEMLLRFYFGEIGSYYGVSSPHLCKLLGIPSDIPSAQKKTHAMHHFVNSVRHSLSTYFGYKKDPALSIGFSDDSLHNIQAMTEYFQTHDTSNTNDKIRIYYTGKSELPDTLSHIPHSVQQNITTLRIS